MMRPRLPGSIIARPALLHRLDAALQFPLTVLSAPAGFGKTTLVSDWLHQRRLSCIWLSLEPEDNDAGVFWARLAQGLGELDSRFTLQAMASRGLRAPEAVPLSEGLLQELQAFARSWKAPETVVLVLDDFHHLDKPGLVRSFERFLDQLPGVLHCILTTRHRPDLHLPRRRARHQLLELDADQLRFDLDSTRHFLQQRMDITLGEEALLWLHQRTEGWVAALQLVGLALHPLPPENRDRVALEVSEGTLSDYLLEEVYAQQEPALQQLLSLAAHLPRFSAGLLDAALPTTRSDELIETLCHRNVLILPLDVPYTWYRLHDLFRDWLRQRPHPATLPAFRARAAHWLEAQGSSFESAELWLEERNWTALTALIRRRLEDWLAEGQIARAIQLLERIPLAETLASPWLRSLRGIAALHRGDFVLAEAEMTAVDSLVPPPEEPLQLLVVFLRSQIANLSGQALQAVAHLNRLRTLPGIEDSRLSAWIRQSLGGMAFAEGRLADAIPLLQNSILESRRHGDRFCEAIALGFLVPTLLHVGRPAQAEAWIAEFDEALAPHTPPPLSSLPPYWQAMLLAEANDLEAARMACESALQRGLLGLGRVECIYFGYLCWYIALARQDIDAARQSLADMAHHHADSREGWQFVIPSLDAMAAVTAAVEGDLAPLRLWAARRRFDEMDGPALRQSAEQLLWLRARMLAGEAVDHRLQGILAEVRQHGVVRRELQCQLLLASSALLRGDLPLARARTLEGLTLSRRHGFLRTVLDEGPLLPRLLTLCENDLNLGDEARRLLAQIAPDRHPLDGASDSAPTGPSIRPVPKEARRGLYEALSPREQEILVLLDQGLSNLELGDRLGISATTVKTHLRNIFGKIGARNRTQALAIARREGLLA